PPATAPPTNAPGRTTPRPDASGTSSTSLDLTELAAKVDPGLVDINSRLSKPNVQAAGTGIVLSSSGLVLTNNHVIDRATSITVTDIGNQQTYPATVVGFDRAHDVAVLQLQGASGLATAAIGDSDTVKVGQEIAALGNADGLGGTPSIAAGKVTNLHQTVNVRDDITGSSQQLTGMIRVSADVRPGESGGPLVNAAGQVIGVITAGPDRSRSGPAAEGLAIPINDAIAISKQIETGVATSTIHLGPT
ncbi:MAG: S1C family serine protease, partial [Pseudonocardiaceae bacterium]